jgi:hypothetical protein
MNILLWALQMILSIKLLTVTLNHAIAPDDAKMQPGVRRFGAARRPLLILVGLLALLGAAGLLLPGLDWLAAQLPWTAGLVAVFLLLSMGFHLAARDDPKLWVSLILSTMAAFLAYGRLVLAPL